MKVKEKKEESGSEKAQGERNEKKRSERSLKGEVEGNEREWSLLY